MGSIVIELQRDALNTKIKVTDLLRKALVVATKLGLSDFKKWIEKELTGYKEEEIDFPEYRQVSGRVQAFNPYRGWMTLQMASPEMEKKLSKRNAGQSIGELEDLIDKDNNGSFMMHFSSETQNYLNGVMNYPAEVALFVQKTSIVRITDAVRNIILNWTLKLEEGGVFGEGMTFTPEEKRHANSTTLNNINNFFGSVLDSQIQQGTSHSSQVTNNKDIDLEAVKEFLRVLTASLPNLRLGEEEEKEVTADISTIKSQTESPKPKSSIIKEGLHSIRAILEGAGGVVSGELLIHLGKVILGG